jgi:CheY-like chemotaxis protein
MRNARIFIVEDTESDLKWALEALELSGHEIFYVATSLEGALKVIDSGGLKEKNINLAIIDGCFAQKDGGADYWKINGPRVAETIRHHYEEIKIVAFTSLDAKYGTYGDVYISKRDGKIQKLLDAIASL